MLSSLFITSMAASLNVPQASAENRTDAHLSEHGKLSYSSGYTQITVLPSYNDRGRGGWRNGLYAELSVTAKKSGEYKMYILCNTNDSGRVFEVKNETAQTSSVGTVNGNHYSTLDYMQVISVDISLAEGSNLLKFQAPSGKTAPNFIAMTIVGLSS